MYCYSLRIDVINENQIHQINEILGVNSNYLGEIWELEIIRKEGDTPFYFVDHFLSLLKGKYEKLEAINVLRENIAIWILYEYEDQCNMEFSPREMKELGTNGITLCISCWEKE